MQINLNKFSMIEAFKWLGWVLFIIVLFLKCDKSEPSTITVKIPEETVILKTDTLIQHKTVEVAKWYKDNENEIKLKKDVAQLYERLKLYEEEFTWMQDEFANEDSVGKAKLYKLATELKEFNENWEDDKYKLNLKGFVSANTIREITPTITRKEFEFTTAVPQVKFRLLLGGGAGISKELNQGLIKANLGFQNKKGNVALASYMQLNKTGYILGEYNFSIFTLKGK
jgi:hypothetical protein